MKVERNGLFSPRRCRYEPKIGELTPDEDGCAKCPVCQRRLLVTRLGALRPHADYAFRKGRSAW